ncbi:MAG: Gfo/Idh/MocA family oxidoreductase, partial [bacterium]
MKLKVALVGLGKDWQSRYLPAFRLLQDRMQVVAIYSAVRTLADSAARDLQAISHTGFREMIASDSIDAVFLLESEW